MYCKCVQFIILLVFINHSLGRRNERPVTVELNANWRKTPLLLEARYIGLRDSISPGDHVPL